MNRRLHWIGLSLVLTVCGSAESAAAARLDGSGYIRDWLVSGPWPSYQVNEVGQGLATDFLKKESLSLPFPGKKETATFVANREFLVAALDSKNEWGFAETKTFDASWRTVSSAEPILRFNGTFSPIDDFFVVYAACYIRTIRQIDAELRVGSDDDHLIYLDQKAVGHAVSSQDVIPGSFRYSVHLGHGLNRLLFKLQDRTHGCGFCVQLVDKNGHPVPDVEICLDARGHETTLEWQLARERSPKRLRERLAAAQKKTESVRAKLAQEKTRNVALSNEAVCVRQALDETYRQIEATYAKEHARAQAVARKGVVEPLLPVASSRSSLCINGFWESSADDGKTWGTTRLPCRLTTPGMQPWTNPSAAGNRPLKAFADTFDKVHAAERPRFRTRFDWDGKGTVWFRCDAIVDYEATFFLNGKQVGEWFGYRGIVRMPLAGAKVGSNELEIRAARSPVFRYNNSRSGIRGDLFIETAAGVHVDDVWVKTSWRKCELTARTTVTNATDRPVRVVVRGMAVKDCKVRFRLPEKSLDVPARGCAEADVRDLWADPELWGIGGAYGGANVYTLVTDVVVGGKVTDRHETEFGFREFWINRTDFYLNGRRVFLQGDIGHLQVDDFRNREVVWPLYRKEGMNMVRFHDTDQWSVTAVRDADRMGMAVYAQMYPKIATPGVQHNVTNFQPYAEWFGTKEHVRNTAAYTRWWKDLRNHPSVLIWSTDNEIITQCFDNSARAAFNERNDRIGAYYEKFVKSFDPDLVMTRDGDVGTWSRKMSRWYEDPPCDTANYHYANEDNERLAVSWQATYDYRPLVLGETMYCAYWTGSKWLGAIPELVNGREKLVRTCARLYREQEIPCVVWMGLGLDGFANFDETGKGNPWGIRRSDVLAWKKDRNRPMPGRRPGEYPWLRIDWPAFSGEGGRRAGELLPCDDFGTSALNVYDPDHPSHIRNAVNCAYAETLRPQEPIDSGRYAEVIVEAAANDSVWTETPAGVRCGVRADANGRAWFRALVPGIYVFGCVDRRVTVDLKPRGADVTKPGFINVPHVVLGQ